MRHILEVVLAFCARKIIEKYQPKVIGITGSVGKTSTRAAVFAVVSKKFRAYTPPKNLNDKLGLPLAIIGMDSPGRSLFGWVRVFTRVFSLLLLRRSYPEVLVLESGIDRVGEMDDLLAIAKPHIGILTSIGLSHYEFFQDVETIEREKGKLIEAVDAGGFVLLNADNELAAKQVSRARGTVVTYGAAGTVRFLDRTEELTDKARTTYTAHTPTREFSVAFPALGFVHWSSTIAAVAVAEVLGIETDLVQAGLQTYRPVAGRLNVIGALRRSVLIDDTYNAAPDSMHEALALFARFPSEHKIAALGDMLELGALSDEAHHAVGLEVARIAPTHLVTVGAGGKIIAESAVGAGYPEERVISFDTSEQAQLPVQELMRESSVVLVKGSQGMRMERISKEIMAEPMRAGELLCRQYGKWLTS